MGRFKDLSGERFDRWTVLSRGPNNKQGQATWLCECSCGTKRVVRGYDLRSGKSFSCGCLRIEELKEIRTTHGMSSTRFYRIWAEMIKRCTNENYKQFHDYGGRGIKVCDRWDEFENFKDDMYEEYIDHSLKHGEKKTSIDRINVNGNYSPDNCKWSTPLEQSKNQRLRTNNKSGVKGVHRNKNTGKWIARIKVNYVDYHIGSYDSFEDAVNARLEGENRYWNY